MDRLVVRAASEGEAPVYEPDPSTDLEQISETDCLELLERHLITGRRFTTGG